MAEEQAPPEQQEQSTKVKIGSKEYEISDIEQSLNLSKALSDPDTGREIIEQLARRTGLIKDSGEVVKKKGESEAAAERRVQKTLKAKLGKDFEIFADKFGPVMDDILEEMFEEHKTSFETAAGTTGWEGEVERFTEDVELTEEIETEMQRLIKRNGGAPKGLKGKAAQEYLKDMFDLASHKLGVETPEPKERGRRPRRGIDEIPEFREEKRPKGVMTTEQAVDAAMRGIRFRD
jgi:hypothetical protein